MARRHIIECDRCHHEIRNETGISKLSMGDRSDLVTKDLCGGCKRDLDKFLAGEQLEVPP